ncbi:MAG: hypothetical protein U1D55_16800 [Phycisphaerae bacterium]
MRCVRLFVGVIAISALGSMTASGQTVYRLDSTSTFQQGCFPPCMCPYLETSPGRGAFTLTRVGVQNDFDVFEVRDIVWLLARPSGESLVTGSGKYLIGGATAPQHQLILDLSIDKASPERFDSRLQPLVGGFPSIDIGVSINGFFCWDTAFNVVARPAPAADVRHYNLGLGSTYQEGCFAPCACPLSGEQPMRGKLTLVKLADGPLFTEYAVIGVDTFVIWPAAPSLRLMGGGSYRVGGEVAVTHQMKLTLADSFGRVDNFDSQLVIGGSNFPFIDITMTINNFFCYDRVLRWYAAPVRPKVALDTPAP